MMVLSKEILLQLLICFEVALFIRSSNRLHIDLPEEELLKVNDDRIFVRVYHTVKQEAEGASITSYPYGWKHGDIFQDIDGRIIIYPGGNIDNPMLLGIGDYRYQLKLISDYLTQSQPSKNPLIRSFLVDYEVIRDILNPDRIATKDDPDYVTSTLSINVDRYAANQFELKREDADSLRRNALPNSLVTYYTANNVESLGREHWGTIRPIGDLYEKLGLPRMDIPGAYSKVQLNERERNATLQMDNRLQDIYDLSVNNGNENELQAKLNEYNYRYVTETASKKLEMTDILSHNLKAFINEAKIQRTLNDRFYGSMNLNPKLRDISQLDFSRIPGITNDHMYISNENINIYDLISKESKFNTQFERAAKFLASVEAYCNELKEVTKNQGGLKEINHLAEPKQILKEVYGGEFTEKITVGFTSDLKLAPESTDIFSKRDITSRLQDITDFISKKLLYNRGYFVERMTKKYNEILKTMKILEFKTEVIVKLGKSTQVEETTR